MVTKILKNKYLLISILFLVWMTFFDTNSWFYLHSHLNHEIVDLKNQKANLTQKIETNKNFLEHFNGDLEKYARENYKVKNKEEDVYIIVYDSIKITKQ